MKRVSKVLIILGLFLILSGMFILILDTGNFHDDNIDKKPALSSTGEVNQDEDGDGLTNYSEINKYFTDPNKKDSDDDGIPDGDWDERREFTYSIKMINRIVRPWNKDIMNDDYQDVKVINESQDYLEVEVIYYPMNTNMKSISENKNWKTDYSGMTEYLKPGITTNWDEKMKQDLMHELNLAGIYPDRLSDKELVKRVTEWIWNSTELIDGMPMDFAVYYKNGFPEVFPELRSWFDKYKPVKNWTDEDVFNNLLLGKQMFYNKKHGSCSSSAILQATIFKALGIPARIISAVPAIDGNDDKQMDLMLNNLTNHRVKNILKTNIPSGGGFANHFYNEVFVGNRWVRLNYNVLGANNFGEGSMGLQFHIDSFQDFSKIELAKYWGMRLAGKPAPKLTSINPYQMLEISDCFGRHCSLPNPVVEYDGLKEIRLKGAYVFGDPAIPSWVKVRDEGHYIVLAFGEWLKEKNYKQLDDFQKAIGEWDFILRSKEHPDIEIKRKYADVNWSSKGEFQAYGFKLTDYEWNKLKPGVKYSIVAINKNDNYKWYVNDGVTLTRK